MHKKFDHTEIEKKWQARWNESGIYTTDDSSSKPKQFILDMFPYPSGEGLHVGHPKGYIATDVYSRFKKMSGFEVLHPMGWDAFGLPAENYAIKNKVHPRVAVEKNIARYKSQLGKLGCNYDWSREINTTDPEYYKWTQWIFLKLLEKGLAYQSYEPINWCPSCQTGLANEDLESDGTCERCGSVVEKKPMRQWVLKITDYADRMLEDLDTLTKWPSHIKEAQRQWIGKSSGAEIDFTLSTGDTVTVFTTRPDTLFGATYLVLAPEHDLILKHKDAIKNWSDVATYMSFTSQKDEIARTKAEKDKTGVLLEGLTAINPVNGEVIPVFIADYVLKGYGTGAIMAVPAHDERDFTFAKKFNVEIRQVVVPCAPDSHNPPQDGMKEVKRETVIVHLKNKLTGKYAILRWHQSLEGISTAIMGGVEEGQTPEDAALAEIREEAGILNAVITKKLSWITGATYCASHKNQNRLAHTYAFIAEFDGAHVQEEIAGEEQALHTLEWVDEPEMSVLLTPDHQKFVWKLLNTEESALTGDGYLMNSGEFDWMSSEEAGKAIVAKVGARLMNTYRIKDWVFSRQRYWGEPIPVIHCEKCGVVPVPYDELPLKLPEVENYAPTGTGESPLANIAEWVNIACPKCQSPAKRETNTMPQWAGSSWYYLRFIDPQNDKALIDPGKEKKWMPVDVYVGGDHAVRHLIYARFWHKFLYDIGAVHTIEPFERLEFLGFILAEDGRKMSKRWGNVINPDDIVALNGADTLRVYEMFMGPFENTVSWSTDSLVGAQRFLERINGLDAHIAEMETKETLQILHRTIKKIGDDIEGFKFNTAISALMIFINHVEKAGLSKESYSMFLRLLAPFAPHLTEELWERAGMEGSIHEANFPVADVTQMVSDTIKISVQIGGKMRGTIEVSAEADENVVMGLVRANEALNARITSEPKRVIYVPGKIINIIV